MTISAMSKADEVSEDVTQNALLLHKASLAWPALLCCDRQSKVLSKVRKVNVNCDMITDGHQLNTLDWFGLANAALSYWWCRWLVSIGESAGSNLQHLKLLQNIWHSWCWLQAGKAYLMRSIV
jgi:hypothetical protein